MVRVEEKLDIHAARLGLMAQASIVFPVIRRVPRLYVK